MSDASPNRHSSDYYLTKSEYQRYKQCAAGFWESFRVEKPPVSLALQAVFDEAQEVKRKALSRYPHVRTIPDTEPATAEELTLAAMSESTDPIANATLVSTHGVFAKIDLLQWNAKLQAWDVYAIHAVTGLLPEHFESLALQAFALQDANIPVGRCYITYLNYNYTRTSELSIAKLFKTREHTQKVIALLSDPSFIPSLAYARKIKRHALLTKEPRPARFDCECWAKPAALRCRAYPKIHSQIPAFSTFDVRLLGKNSQSFYKELFAREVYAIEDLSEELLSKMGSKAEFVRLYQEQATKIDQEAIREELSWLSYPLYFLDYETTKSAVPRWEDVKPYEQTVFQYSLHVLTAPPNDPASQLLHYEYLHDDESDPTSMVAEMLMSQIGETGSVIVWNQSFEKNRNSAMGERYPSSQEFFENINNRVYDLMNIFKKNLYQDWRFQGSASIKAVLPVLCPDLASYKDLDLIANGEDAMYLWPKAVFGDLPTKERKAIFSALKKYCELDTLAMVKILEHLYTVVELENN